jgi:ankyrin repeat protein
MEAEKYANCLKICNSRHLTPREFDNFLRENDIDPQKVTDALGRTPLHIASRISNPEIVLHLLRHYNLNPNVADCLGRTPLSESIMCIGTIESSCQIIRYLKQFGANLNHISHDGYNALQFSLEMKYWDIARTLVESGIKIDEYGPSLKTPQYYLEKYPDKCGFLRIVSASNRK